MRESTAFRHCSARADQLLRKQSLPSGNERCILELGLVPYPEGPFMDLLTRITHDPEVMGGRACIRGMRVTVSTILGLLAVEQSIEKILADYPYLERLDVLAALSYAAWRTSEVDLPLRAS